MIEVTIRASFGDIPAMAGFFTKLAHVGVVPDSIDTEPSERVGSVTQPLIAAGPFGGQPQQQQQQQQQQQPARRGRKPRNATAAVLDQPQGGPAPATGPFGAPAQPQPAAFAGPAPTLMMLQAKVSELISQGKMGSVIASMARYGAVEVSGITEDKRAAFFAELQTL